MNQQYPKWIYFVGLMLVVNLLWMNHSVSLWDEDEAAYAGFGIEMLRTGDWVHPNYQWSIIHRKTPFHFWTIAVSYQLFGINEFAVRIPSVLAILFTCLLVYRLGRALFGEKEALWAAVILATSVQLPLMGKISFTDASLLLFQTIAVLSLFNFLYKPSWKWNSLFWGSMAIGILVKGPPIILLTGGIWLLTAIFHPKRKVLIKTHPWFLGPVALIPFAAWCYASYTQDYTLWEQSDSNLPFETWWQIEDNGRKIHLLPFLWDWYVMRRIGGSVLGQSGFWGYHFVVLTVAFLTWLPFWFASIRSIFTRPKNISEKQLLLIFWVIMGWFFWELMSSKLPSYAMAAQPALAILMAFQINNTIQYNTTNNWVKGGLAFYTVVFALIIVLLPIAGYYYIGSATLFYLVPMSLILTSTLYYVFKHKQTPEAFVRQLAVHGAVFMFLVWACVAPLVENSPAKSFDDIIETAYQLVDQNASARLIFTGLDIKQRKISLLVYAKRYFGKYEELSVEEAIRALKTNDAATLIIGTESIETIKTTFKQEQLPFKLHFIEHRSLDHALRRHDFWVVSNQ